MSAEVAANAPFAAAPALVIEDSTTDSLQQPTAPMSVTYILNSPDSPEGKSQQDLPSIPTASIPYTPTIAPAAPGGLTDDTMASDIPLKEALEEKAPTGLASPVPSTGNAPANGDGDVVANGASKTTDVDTKTKDGTGTNGTAAGTFRCMNDEFEECRTGQTTIDLSRKVISDHFGRNKACTRLIADWPLFCRKHYQRATYNQKLWQSRKITLILRQFNIVEAQFPGTKYTVALKKSEEQRLNTFSRKLAAGKTEREAAAMVAPTEKGKHFEAPVNVLREIEQLNYLGEDKTKAEAEAAVSTIRDMLESEDTTQVPSIEFLPQLDAAGNPYDASNRRKSPKKSSVRVSKKGAITKPSSTTKTPKKSASRAEIEAAVNTIDDMLESEDKTQAPPLDFLPQLEADANPYDAGNHNPYDAGSHGKSPKKTSARVSKKGAITKPSSTNKAPKHSASKA
ncbi:uncharacterized protein N0V89_000270 [Didymosphaeria variabile]|uniref:Uncharacterized protein n=1 Tax=Didymosphaeria variabile TaxID=1932322 RepID=A0A9W8XX31_9PLEO|nr:uncharacterized protein N0V89_000270 [Didymosphaeria variabile]KAJ4359714.1 hypothetical protein N0V89_000270 [Didymosphaeria variabile]